ncbi:replisome organizer region-containing protein [Clostridium sp. DL-VIII]|uniref:phage replisome organizer N-terminal domain-containing protein n=1 Tax=Clostridium sp. DL-VIII TaxID=641107 RepID=UPI00023AF104|nr:phage replisome organizer N-terminal domain-containing protein [Clostridium sp. DL-VIII]EHI97556.1 replisome organizer region-containing protein [Clostridium sp. DL-VIII]
MADIKWIKLATCMADDEKMKLIDAMPERDTVHYLWIRLLIQAAKTNADGEIFLSEDMPYTDKMLAVIFSRPLASIKLALKTLSRLGMIEIDYDKVIRIVNWDKHQNIEGMERVREQNRKRAENHREKKKLDKKAAKSNKEETHDDEVLEEDIDLEKDLDLDENKTIEEKKNLEENKALNKNEALEKLETSEESSENTVIDDKTNTATNEAASDISAEIANNNEDLSNNIIETVDNNCNGTKNTSNVTQNESNVTVTEQNKKEIEIEIENKKKNKKEKKEIDKDKNIESNKNSISSEEVSQSSLFEQHNNTKSECAEDEDIDIKAIELMHYHEKITGKVGVCDYIALRSAIDIHGEKRVKMAMDVGFEKNCHDIKYAIGVLKNWRRDGYPEDHMEVKKNGVRSNGKSSTADKNEFAGFKPKEPRKLTEDERKRIQANLI